MSPGTVNDSAREVQAELAKLLKDYDGTLLTSGTATAYTVTLNTTPAALSDGLSFMATAGTTNTGGATTFVVTPSGASAFASKKIKVYQSGVEGDPTAGSIIAGNRYRFTYRAAGDSATGAYILENPSSDALVLLTSGTISAAGSQDLTLPTTYRDFKLVLSQTEPATAGATLNLRFSYDSGSSYKAGASDYDMAGTHINAAGTTGTIVSTGGSAALLGVAQAIVGGQGGSFEVDISTPDVSSHYTTFRSRAVMKGDGTSLTHVLVSGRCTASSLRATNARLLYGTGNISAGRYQLYGLRA